MNAKPSKNCGVAHHGIGSFKDSHCWNLEEQLPENRCTERMFCVSLVGWENFPKLLTTDYTVGVWGHATLLLAETIQKMKWKMN